MWATKLKEVGEEADKAKRTFTKAEREISRGRHMRLETKQETTNLHELLPLIRDHQVAWSYDASD
jgi:hypothetical protein